MASGCKLPNYLLEDVKNLLLRSCLTNGGKERNAADIWAGNACRCLSSCNEDVCICALANCLANGALNNVVSSSKAVGIEKILDLCLNSSRGCDTGTTSYDYLFSCLLLRDRTGFLVLICG